MIYGITDMFHGSAPPTIKTSGTPEGFHQGQSLLPSARLAGRRLAICEIIFRMGFPISTSYGNVYPRVMEA